MMKKVIDDWPLKRRFTFGELRVKPIKDSKLFVWTNSSRVLTMQKNENEKMSKDLSKIKKEVENYVSKDFNQKLIKKRLEYDHNIREYERNLRDSYKITNAKDEEVKESLKDFDEDIFKNKIFLESLEEQNDISINKYNAPKQNHGFSAFMLSEDIIAFTLHSSQPTFSLFGIEVDNLKVEEDLNPIKYVNPIHFMKIKDFLNAFNIYGPEKLLSSKRYGVNEDYDLAYCAFRAGVKSMQTGKTAVVLTGEENDAIKKISVEDEIQIDEQGIAMMPALIKAQECDPEYIANMFEESLEMFSRMDNDIEAKKKMLGEAGEVFKNIENIDTKGDILF